jgi:hypothetical protein
MFLGRSEDVLSRGVGGISASLGIELLSKCLPPASVRTAVHVQHLPSNATSFSQIHDSLILSSSYFPAEP